MLRTAVINVDCCGLTTTTAARFRFLQTTAVGTSRSSALVDLLIDSIIPRRGSAWTLLPVVLPSAAQKALLWKMIEDAVEMVVAMFVVVFWWVASYFYSKN